MRTGRIDYRLRRRAVLRDVVVGVRFREDLRDAHPDLVRAGLHIGTPAGEPCPLCDDASLVHVTYVFDGKSGWPQGGRAVPRESLARQVERYGDLTVYTVEVCSVCRWHHLVESFQLLARDTAVG